MTRKHQNFRQIPPNFHVSTFNTQTISKDHHLLELDEALLKINYDVIGLCEVKRQDEEIIERPRYILYTKTKTRRRGSVGFLIHSKWKENIVNFKGYSDRVCTMTLTFNKKIFGFVQAYAPTSSAPDFEIDTFYGDLTTACDEISKSHWYVIMGDFNAKIGETTEEDSDVMGKFGFGVRNDRGRRLIEFAREKQLFIANTMFKKRNLRRPTWSLGRASNEIDFVMIPKNMKKLVKDIDVLNRFNFKSDHKMVRMQLGLKFIRPKYTNYTKRIYVDNEKTKIDMFRENLESNRIAYDETTPMNMIYEDILNSITSSAEPFMKNKPKESIITQETKDMIKLREQLIVNRKRSLEDDAKFKEIRKKSNQMIQRDTKNYEILELERAIENNQSWKRAKEGVVRNKNWIPKLRDKNNVLRSNRAEILEIAASYYEELY